MKFCIISEFSNQSLALDITHTYSILDIQTFRSVVVVVVVNRTSGMYWQKALVMTFSKTKAKNRDGV